MDAALVRDYVEAAVATDPRESAQSAAGMHAALEALKDRLKAGQSSVFSIVQSLGTYLTTGSDGVRAQGTSLLSSVLADCDPQQLTPNAVDVLVTFYCERLDDQMSVPELFKGLFALVRFDAVTSQHVTKIVKAYDLLRDRLVNRDFCDDDRLWGLMQVTATFIGIFLSIFENVRVQTYQQATRFTAFQIVEVGLEKHSQSMLSLGDEFIFGFVQAMDGEKDPRNLLLLFRLVIMIIQKFDISHHVEDMFDVVFCYFPITFKAPSDDPYGITPEDLKQRLRSCIAATPQFGKFAAPLVVEKLTASSGAAKRDAADTLAMCAPVYGAEALAPHIEGYWDAMKTELLSGANDALEVSTLAALEAVARALSPSINTAESDSKACGPLNALLQLVLRDSSAILSDQESREIVPMGKILRAITVSSDPARQSIVRDIIPLILGQYTQSKVSTYRAHLLAVVTCLLEASSSLYRTWAAGGIIDTMTEQKKAVAIRSADTPGFRQLLAYKDQLFGLCNGALIGSDEYGGLRLSGLKGLLAMCEHPDYLAENDKDIAVQCIVQRVLVDVDDLVRAGALDALEKLVELSPESLKNRAIPALLNELPSGPSAIQVETIDHPCPPALRDLAVCALTKLAVHQAMFPLIVPELLQRVEFFASRPERQYAQSLLRSLSTISKEVRMPDGDVSGLFEAEVIVERTLSMAIVNAGSLMTESASIDHAAVIIGAVVAKMSSSRQEGIISRVFDVFLKGDLTWLRLEATDFAPLEPNSPDEQTNLSTIFAHALSAVRKDVVLPVGDVAAFLTRLVRAALGARNRRLTDSLSAAAAAVVNKWEDDVSIRHFVGNVIQADVWDTMENSAKTEQRLKAMKVYVWITKALSLRSHVLGLELGSQLAKCLTWADDSSDVARAAAEGFGTIIEERQDGPLSRAHYATIKLLNQQRFFTHCMPLLSQQCNGSMVESVKYHYLTALAHLLRHIPRAVLVNELPPLLPLLLQSLSVDDPTLQLVTIDTLDVAVATTPKIVSEHVGTMTKRLLALSKMGEGSAMGVRISALRCLGHFANGTLRYELLHPYKQTVIRGLAACLDDKKRAVRREAVICRNKWILLNA